MSNDARRGGHKDLGVRTMTQIDDAEQPEDSFGTDVEFSIPAARVIFARLTDRNRKLETQLADASLRLWDQAIVDEQIERLLNALKEASTLPSAQQLLAQGREAQLRHNIACLSAELDAARSVIARLARRQLLSTSKSE